MSITEEYGAANSNALSIASIKLSYGLAKVPVAVDELETKF